MADESSDVLQIVEGKRGELAVKYAEHAVRFLALANAGGIVAIVTVIVIRADSEDRARTLANLAFGKAVERRNVVAETFQTPWGNPAWAGCEPINSPEYPTEGPEAILSPAWADDEWR